MGRKRREAEQAGRERRGEVGRKQQGTGGGGERKEVRKKEQRGRRGDTRGRAKARARDVTKGRRNIIPQRGRPHVASPPFIE